MAIRCGYHHIPSVIAAVANGVCTQLNQVIVKLRNVNPMWDQIHELKKKGFCNEENIIQVLCDTNGEINRATERLALSEMRNEMRIREIGTFPVEGSRRKLYAPAAVQNMSPVNAVHPKNDPYASLDLPDSNCRVSEKDVQLPADPNAYLKLFEMMPLPDVGSTAMICDEDIYLEASVKQHPIWSSKQLAGESEWRKLWGCVGEKRYLSSDTEMELAKLYKDWRPHRQLLGKYQ